MGGERGEKRDDNKRKWGEMISREGRGASK